MEAWRIYAAVTGCVAYGSTAGLFVSLLRDDETWLTEWLAASMVFMGQFAFIAFNVKTFPWRYSVLGRFRRTAAPSAPARYTAKNAGGIVGNMGSLFITWLVFDAGIELQIDICGKAFIPREAVCAWSPIADAGFGSSTARKKSETRF